MWEEAAPRWDACFQRDAVQAAATRIFDVELPKKLRVQPSKNTADLFAAFAPDKTVGPLLRFTDLDPVDRSWASCHKGSCTLVRGVSWRLGIPGRTGWLLSSQGLTALYAGHKYTQD